MLLPLLGEALVFLNTPKRTLTLSHLYQLLAAVEDWDQSGALVKAQCEEVLQTTLAAARGEQPPQPQPRQLSKSVSSSFDLIGSRDFSQDGASVEASAVLVQGGRLDDVERGWDWRRGFPRGVSGKEVVRVLRLGVAREIARAFAEGEVGV